jgi:Tol biopolymer transport system component
MPTGAGKRWLTLTAWRIPAWSPDGRRIAFESVRDGNGEVYVINADGSGQRNLTRKPRDDFAPAWSPGGRKIAFLSNRDGNSFVSKRDSNPEIYVMNTDGSGQRNLTRSPADEGWFAWSPVRKK